MKYNTAIIGGGPAGMMAAIQAAQNGLKVVLVEKNNDLGRKLLITGGGRCNITNAIYDTRELVEKYGENGKFLFSALTKFGVADLLEFLDSLGISTKEEDSGRIVPESESAMQVKKILHEHLKELQVEIVYSPVDEIKKEGNRITSLKLKNQSIEADAFIIATGGITYPSTGSTGDGLRWAKELGHTVVNPQPALCPLILDELWIGDLQGLSLKDTKMSIFCDNKKEFEEVGDLIFTHVGISGPLVLNSSKKVNTLLSKGSVTLSLDFVPDQDFSDFECALLEEWNIRSNRSIKKSLEKFLPERLVKILIWQANIEETVPVNSVFKEERKKLIHLIKDFQMKVKGLADKDKAMITSGGINLKEIDPKTMKSKIMENLYFAGEILDLDGPTGGYNLQVAWSTGFIAGTSSIGE